MATNSEMPNLFIIGAAKCGTTSLHRYLDLHPEISMSKIKEPDFFLRHLPEDSRPRVGDRGRYLALFESGSSIRGESSPHYSIYPRIKGVPAAIASEVPGARLIYLVRDPIERIASLASQMISVRARDLSMAGESIDLRRWIGDLSNPDNFYVASGRYMTQLDQYLEYFPKESILVLDSDRLRADREQTMDEVFAFLDLDPGLVEGDFDSEMNQSEDLTVKPGIWQWLKRRQRLRRAWRRLPDSTRDRVSGLVGRNLGQPVPRPRIDESLRFELEGIFRPEVERLSEFTGQDFADWSI